MRAEWGNGNWGTALGLKVLELLVGVFEYSEDCEECCWYCSICLRKWKRVMNGGTNEMDDRMRDGMEILMNQF